MWRIASAAITGGKARCCTVRSTSIVLRKGAGEGNYFIVASRLLPYKRIELAIGAAQIAEMPLVIAGTGPDQRRLAALAAQTPWVRMTGYVGDAELNALMGNALAAIVPGEEDFGLVPLEAAAAGRPALAYRGGGALETIVEGTTGEFFDEPSAQALGAAMRGFARATTMRTRCAPTRKNFRRKTSFKSCARSSRRRTP